MKKVIAILLASVMLIGTMPNRLLAVDENNYSSEGNTSSISNKPDGWNDLKEMLSMIISMTIDNEEEAKAEYERRTRLDGDILIGTDTEHTAVKKVKLNDKMDFTGTLKVSVIKEAVKEITQGVGAFAKLEGVKSQFMAKFTLPDGMIFGESLTKENVKLQNAQDIFKVTKVSVEGQTVSVLMDFVDPVMGTATSENPYIVRDLFNALNKVNDTLKVTIPGVEFDKTKVKEGDTLTVKGELSGNYQMEKLTTAHYDPRIKDMLTNYLKNPAELEKFKDVMPNEYQEFLQTTQNEKEVVQKIQALADDVKALRDEFNIFVNNNREVIDRYLSNDTYNKSLYENYSNEDNYIFPVDEPFKMIYERLYNRIDQHDGASDVNYNLPKAYSLYGEINLLANNIAKVPRLYKNFSSNISEEQKAQDKAVIDQLLAMQEKVKSFGTKEEGLLSALSHEEYLNRSNITEIYIRGFILQELLTNPEYGGIQYPNSASVYPKMFIGWDAVQSEDGRDFVLENDATADKKAIQLTLKIVADEAKPEEPE